MRLRLRSRQLALAAILSITIAFASGCPKGAYHDAVVAEHQFTTTLDSFQQAEAIEAANGRIDPATHKLLAAGIEKAALAGQTLVSSLQSGAANTTVQQNFATVSAAVSDLLNNGVLGIKNETSRGILQVSLKAVQAILANVGKLLSAPTTTNLTAPKGQLTVPK